MSPISRFLSAVVLMLATTLVHADPPARVGRLAVVENGVNFQVDGEDPGGPASINWPISSGAMLDTDRRGRSEAWVGSTAFRLAPNSHLAFPVVDDRQVVVRLSGGSLAVSVFDRDQVDDVVVETPEGQIRFASPGRYRIDVLSDHTELTAQAGQASMGDAQRSIPVVAGQKASLYGGGEVRLEPYFEPDAFDNWVSERESVALASTSRRYVSSAMTGYQDLDNYGDWNSTAEYGAVWYPRSVADDWAPYRFGRWAWVAPWGWTWVDQSPWGFAPFHYGRWVHVHNRWGWVPGSYVARPVYAPALVAWVGNPGWNVGFRAGAAPAVGWFPLAPREVYVPGFQASSQFVHRVNGGHARNGAEIDRAIQSGPRRDYANRGLPQAVTIVPSSQMSEGRPIRSGDFARHDRRELELAPARSAPVNVAVPPVGGRPARDAFREGEPGTQRSAPPPARPWPGASDQRQPAGSPAPFTGRDENRRGGFGRDERRAPGFPESQPAQPAVREMAPARAPETPRGDTERRWPATGPARAPEAAPVAPTPDRPGPGWLHRNQGRDEQRPPIVREDAPQPASREMPAPEMQRQQRDAPRPFEMQRQREMQQSAPQVAPPQPMRAPMPQVAPAPPPVREMPRPEVRPQPQPQAQPAPQQQHGGERRRDQGDERGGR